MRVAYVTDMSNIPVISVNLVIFVCTGYEQPSVVWFPFFVWNCCTWSLHSHYSSFASGAVQWTFVEPCSMWIAWCSCNWCESFDGDYCQLNYLRARWIWLPHLGLLLALCIVPDIRDRRFRDTHRLFVWQFQSCVYEDNSVLTNRHQTIHTNYLTMTI